MNWQDASLFLAFLVVAAVFAGLTLYYWNKREHKALIDSMSDGVFVLDRRNRVVSVNLTAQKILGEPAEKLVGRPIAAVLSLEKELANGSAVDIPSELPLGKGDDQRCFDHRLSPIHRWTGQFSGWLLVLRDVTDRKQIEDSLIAQKQLFESLVAVARATAEMPTLAATLQNVLDVGASLTRSEFGSLILLDKNGHVTDSILALGRVKSKEQQRARRVLEKGLAGWVMRERQTALINDTLEDDRWIPSADNIYNPRAALAIPIISQTTLLGILTLTHSAPHHFTPEDAYLMQAAADQMALAVRNAQMYEEQRRLADRQLTLYETLRTVGSHLDPEAVARAAVETVARLTDWPGIAVMFPDRQNGPGLVVKATAGLQAAPIGFYLPVEQGITGRAFRTQKLQLVSDTAQDPDYMARQPNTRSELALPLQRGERVLGVLNIESDQLNAFDDDDVQLATSLADTIALALDNAHFHAEVQQYAADLNTLYQITQILNSSLALENVLTEALAAILQSLGYDAGLVGLANQNNGRLTLAAAKGLPEETVAALEKEGLQDHFGAVAYERQEMVIIPDLAEASSTLTRLEKERPDAMTHLHRLEARTCTAIPLTHRQQALGFLCLFAFQPKEMTEETTALQLTIGQQMATTVTNAHLFQAVADERSLFQALIQSSRDGILLVGGKQNILVINAPALTFLQLPGQAEDWVNRSFPFMLETIRAHAPEAVKRLEKEFTLTRSGDGDKDSAEGEFEISPRQIYWLNLPVMAGNTPLGRLLVLRDVTQERLVDRMREDLTRTAVHDLRNPLSSLSSALEFLEIDLANDMTGERQEVIEIAQTSIERMLNLVNAMLDINRLESGHMPLNQEVFSLKELIEETLRTQSPLARQKKISLIPQLPETSALVWADRSLIARVLQNLVGNGIKFTPANGHVRIVVKPPNRERAWFLVSVIDNGRGIPPEIQSRLFQRFVTGAQAESGSGLGLAFCRMVLKAHNELIWVENTPNGGATFNFTLPPAQTENASP